MANQRALKLCIRLMLPVFALGGFGSLWGMGRISTPEEVVTASAWSPDHHYRATVMQVESANGCGPSRSSMVLVERSTFFIRTGSMTPFCLNDAPTKIAVHWVDAETLHIDCSGCNQEYEYADANWGKLHFVYDLDKP